MTPREILARTLWGEDRSGGTEGMEPIAGLILNRAEWPTPEFWGHDVVGVCLAPSQFSCWGRADVNLRKLLLVDLADVNYAAALLIADRALSSGAVNRANGATHYHAKALPEDKLPNWRFLDPINRAHPREPVFTTDHHLFFAIGPH